MLIASWQEFLFALLLVPTGTAQWLTLQNPIIRSPLSNTKFKALRNKLCLTLASGGINRKIMMWQTSTGTLCCCCAW